MSHYYNMSAGQIEKIREESGRFNESWSDEEKQKVCSMFRDGMRIEEIAHMQGRTVNAIRLKLIQAGEIANYLSRKAQEWTDEEKERLGRFHSQGYSFAECAKFLGRIRNEVENKLVDMGLLDPSQAYGLRTATNYANAYEPWTPEENRLLSEELADYRHALSAMMMVAERHGRSVSSIISHALKLGLAMESPDA